MQEKPALTFSQQKLANALYDIGCMDLKGYHRLKHHEDHPDAPLSPILINLRDEHNPKKGPLTSVEIDLCAAEMVEQIKDVKFDHLAPIPNAGVPFAAAMQRILAEKYSRQVSILQMAKLAHADGKRSIGDVNDGAYKPGDLVLPVDDLITKAKSKIEAGRSLKAAGLVVVGFVVLIDRQQGGREELAQAGYKNLWASMKLTDMLDFYVESARVSRAKQTEILQYLRVNS